jgi:hypothetical protein
VSLPDPRTVDPDDPPLEGCECGDCGAQWDVGLSWCHACGSTELLARTWVSCGHHWHTREASAARCSHERIAAQYDDYIDTQIAERRLCGRL